MRRCLWGFSFVGVLCVVFLGGCSSLRYSQRIPASSSYVDPLYPSYQVAVAEALNFRSQALKFAQEKKLGESADIQLTRAEGEFVRSTGAAYLEIRERMRQFALAEADIFAPPHRVIFAPGKGSRIESKPFAYGGLRIEDLYHTVYIDPLDALGQQKIFRIQMSLSSALILMDNYLVAVEPFNSNSSLRYVLNYDVSQRRALQSLSDSYTSSITRQQITRAIEFIDQVMAWRRNQGVATNPEESYLYGITQSSSWYLAVRDGTARSVLTDKATNLWNRITLRGKRGVRAATYGLSMGFGNMVGLVETRKGYLYTMSQAEKDVLISEMKPLDILMEKTPFRLTDKMIPGHYGHVAIWLGTEDQLKDLRVWDQLPVRIKEKVRAGHHVVEALRPGVELNTLEQFLNIDDFLVIRDTRTNITDEYRRQAILQAVSQIGKEYDFNFDIHTHERIVCSEIAYVVFPDIRWPVSEAVRRYTISPDNVVTMAVGPERIFEPVILYYNGKRYFKDLPKSVSLLLKADERSYAEFTKFQNE